MEVNYTCPSVKVFRGKVLIRQVTLSCDSSYCASNHCTWFLSYFQIAVLISNAIANMFQPSFYDSIIRLKRLPFLPDIVSSKSRYAYFL